MSVADQINRIKNGIQSCYEICESKGSTISQVKNLANLPNVIDSIPSGGGSTEEGYTVTFILYDGGTNGTTANIKFIFSDDTEETVSLFSDGSSTSVTKNNVKRLDILRSGIGYYYNWHSQTLETDDQKISLKPTKNTTYTWQCDSGCILEGEKVILRNNKLKNIEDIDYDDELLVWNFDKCCLDYSKPMWIKRRQTNSYYWINEFESGKVIKTTGTIAGHRFFNLNKKKFLYNTECINCDVYTLDGPDKLIKCNKIESSCNFYNVYTNYHMNLFCNGILTGYRYNNLYKIENMKYIKENRILRKREEFQNIPDNWFYGMRCSEQTDTLENIQNYYLNRILISK